MLKGCSNIPMRHFVGVCNSTKLFHCVCVCVCNDFSMLSQGLQVTNGNKQVISPHIVSYTQNILQSLEISLSLL